eukprot:TRINITY_DN9336_c1_g2_i1.p1 TRINITY_DN9336_c1_g2~~TRINITY_DN9336_c1_g2_i1.p1  ORF type:complete len:102 (-),score=2.46 TRINITY_DN9336_c1_g2_i1:21-326(-)
MILFIWNNHQKDFRRMQVLERWCNRLSHEANMSKCGVIVLNNKKDNEGHQWMWGEDLVPARIWYTYLGVEFNENCKWDDTSDAMRKKGNQAIDSNHRLLRM